MEKSFYLDAAATTPIYYEVEKEMKKVGYGNPSSLHLIGEKAKKCLESARKKIAEEINCKPKEIYFTSGGTESNNLALQGIAHSMKKRKIIISSIEHPSVNETANYLFSQGFKVVRVRVDSEGLIDFNSLEKNLSKGVALVSVIHVNNIIGTIQDLKKIGELCKKAGAIFHTDAVQSFGKIKIDVGGCNISLLSASAHKIGGPKGIGILYVRDGINLSPLFFGGGQERGLRSGTENVSGVVGFAKALEITRKLNKKAIERSRDFLIEKLEILDMKINGSREKRIYNNVNFMVPGVEADTLVVFLSRIGIYLS